jgi:hypothetical protein
MKKTWASSTLRTPVIFSKRGMTIVLDIYFSPGSGRQYSQKRKYLSLRVCVYFIEVLRRVKGLEKRWGDGRIASIPWQLWV